MKVKEAANKTNGNDGLYRKARKTHSCDVVKFFGLRPHSQCTGEIKPTQYYFDMNDGDNGSVYKTHKLCRFCAEMEYNNAPVMSRAERDKHK